MAISTLSSRLPFLYGMVFHSCGASAFSSLKNDRSAVCSFFPAGPVFYHCHLIRYAIQARGLALFQFGDHFLQDGWSSRKFDWVDFSASVRIWRTFSSIRFLCSMSLGSFDRIGLMWNRVSHSCRICFRLEWPGWLKREVGPLFVLIEQSMSGS
jgi:hypothetical protein